MTFTGTQAEISACPPGTVDGCAIETRDDRNFYIAHRPPDMFKVRVRANPTFWRDGFDFLLKQ
jgi:hypothetical protein